MKYIDVHAHVFPKNIAWKVISQLETYYGSRWEGTGETDDLEQSMKKSGISRAVIFSSATKPAQVEAINNFIASEQNLHPDLFLGFGTMHQDYENYRDELKRMRDLGLHGLKFHPDFQKFFVDSPRMMRVYEAAGPGMPLLFHIGDWKSDYSSPYRLARVVERFPELTIIAAHMGGYSEWDEARRYLIGKPIWMDISSTIPYLGAEETKKLVLAHGTDRVLFASDYPAVRHERAVGDVLSLGLSPEDNEKIFHLNAERLLGIRP